MKAGHRDTHITIEERREETDPDLGTATVKRWVAVYELMAEVRDMLPSRADRMADGISIGRRPCRIRALWRPGITTDMRISIDGRHLRIVSGPAMLGRHEGMEILAEEISTEGILP